MRLLPWLGLAVTGGSGGAPVKHKLEQFLLIKYFLGNIINKSCQYVNFLLMFISRPGEPAVLKAMQGEKRSVPVPPVSCKYVYQCECKCKYSMATVLIILTHKTSSLSRYLIIWSSDYLIIWSLNHLAKQVDKEKSSLESSLGRSCSHPLQNHHNHDAKDNDDHHVKDHDHSAGVNVTWRYVCSLSR